MSDGHCLRHAYRKTMEYDDKGIPVFYVQGTVTNPATGKTFKHAWVELPNEKLVVDPTIDVVLKTKLYYDYFKPKSVLRIEPLPLVLLSKGLKFYTKQEVEAARNRIKLLDAKMAAKRKNG